jgi:hypothetical protein
MRLAEVLLATERAAEAEPLLREAVADFSAVDPRYAPTGAARARLGEALIALGQRGEGIREMEAGWSILTETMRRDAPAVQRVAATVAAYYDSRDEAALASEWRTRAGR